jgi:hypothetical protein
MMPVTLIPKEATLSCARGCCPTQRDHYRSLVFGVAPAESDKFKGGYTRKFDADMDAYRQLRRDGVQPDRVDGPQSVIRDLNDGRPVSFDSDPLPVEVD